MSAWDLLGLGECLLSWIETFGVFFVLKEFLNLRAAGGFYKGGWFQ